MHGKNKPFSKNQVWKVKFGRFICIRIGGERFAMKSANIFSFGMFLEEKIYH